MPSESAEPDESPVWVDTGAVFDAVAMLRADTAWSGTYVPVPTPQLGHPAADDAVGRAGFLWRNLPRRYSERLADGAEAITRAAAEVQLADRIETD